jgi:formyl-CoA transferase
MPAALEGIRVIEAATYVTGPFAGVMLADLGAEVLKIEEPERGDPFRAWGQGDYSPTFCSLNRNKKSVALDLRTEEGRSALLRLIDTADVLIENYRPGVAERLGFGYEAVRLRNPRLIYCSITGFGPTGPYRNRPGYDTVGQAMSGLLSLLTDLESPQPMGISLSDHVTGMYACYGILGALMARERRGGMGQLVETSLLQATVAFVAENAARFFAEGRSPSRESRTRLAQVYAFRAGDGKAFVVHLSSPQKFWEGLVRAVGRDTWLDDPRFRTRPARQEHYWDLHAALAEIFRTASRAEWLARLEQRDVPCAPISTLAEVFDDPQVQHLGLRMCVEHPQRGPVDLVAPGVRLERTPALFRLPPPTLGEHTKEVLEAQAAGGEEQRARSDEEGTRKTP